MKEQKKSIMRKLNRKEQEGSAMLFAVVVMMVVMIFTLLLLLSAYSLYHLAITRTDKEQARELAKTLSQRLEEQMTVSFSTKKAEDIAKTAGEDALWFYVKDHIWQTGSDSWPYYNDDEWGHEAKYAYRYFNIGFDDGFHDIKQENITVRLSWESENGVEEKSGTLLEMEVSVNWKGQYSTVKSTYELQVDEYMVAGAPPDAVMEERWCWALVERE